MVKGYVQNSRTIVLAMVQTTNDIANQVIIQLTRKGRWGLLPKRT